MKKKQRIHQLMKLSIIANTALIIGLLFFLVIQFKNDNQVCTTCLLEKLPLLHTSSGPKTQGEILRFAVISDPQVKDGSQLQFLNKALQKAKEEEVKFVVITGDLSQDGKTQQLEAAKKALDESGLKYYTVPGNHDVLLGGIQNYQKVFGEAYKKMEIQTKVENSKIKKVVLMLIDNSRLISDEQQIDDRQIKWLENELVRRPKQSEELTLAFMHFPLGGLRQREREILKKYFCSGAIDGLFAGHLHVTERFYTWCTDLIHVEKKGKYIPTFNVSSISLPTYNELEGFQIFHYFENGEVETERIVLAERADQPSTHEDVIKNYRK